MWQPHRIKEILFSVVVTLFIITTIDITDGRMRDERRMWVATPMYRKARRSLDNTTLPQDNIPEEFNSSELGPGMDSDIQGGDGPLGWGGFWSGLIWVLNDLATLTPGNEEQHKVRTCYMIATTYTSATSDLRRYFNIRYFYENNLEYEVGYMVNEIITKYQRMLELYYIAQERFFNNQGNKFARSTYMFYLYTNVLEQGSAIAHMCHILHDLEARYEMVPKSGFDDYHTKKKSRGPNGTAALEKAQSNYEKQLQQERKRRERERRKQRKKNLYAGFKPTTPDRRPKHGRNFPLDYGWSIEHW